MNRKIEIAILIVYTIINLKFLAPFIFDNNLVIAAALKGDISNSFLALFVGLFLNTTLVLYWFNKNNFVK